MKSLLFTVLFLLTCYTNYYCVDGSKILMLTPVGSKSHKTFFWGLAEALGQKGHEVTVVSMYKNKDVKNVRDIVLPGPSLDSILKETFTHVPNTVIRNIMTNMPTMCSESLGYYHNDESGIKDEKFDLVILSMFFNFCYLSVIYEQQVPYIYVSPAGIFSIFSNIIGNVWIPSVEPNKLLSQSYPLTFFDRLKGTVFDLLFLTSYIYYSEPSMERICREKGLCPNDMPHIDQFHQNVSLILANDVRTLDIPARPMMPNIVYAGALHCRPGKPLPQDLEEWVEGSGDAGFIFFSMGSAMTPSFLTEKYRKILLKAFSALEQRVLFKWDQPTMEDLPDNVKLGQWLPQQDLLAHPKIKLFVTHGGLHSTMETTYHGVPIIGIPIMADQYSNLHDAQNQGWAKVITWDELEEEKLVNLIKEVMKDENMKKFIGRRAAIMKDQLLPPAEIATYWVEYVLRHKGADHIKSPIGKMPWYKLYNVDVWSTLAVLLLGIIYGILKAFKCLLSLCFSTSSKSPKKMKKN